MYMFDYYFFKLLKCLEWFACLVPKDAPLGSWGAWEIRYIKYVNEV